MSKTSFERFEQLGVIPFDLRNTVYKYRSIEKACEIIKTNEIYFPTSNELPDKLELHQSLFDLSFTSKTKIKFFERVLGRSLREAECIPDKQFSDFLLTSIEELKNKVGILSTGKSSTNSFLWERYANNHKGICLGFKIPDYAFSSHLAFNVNYTENPLKIKFIDENTAELTKDIFYCLCTKHKSYISEEEVRVLDESHHGIKPFLKPMLHEIIFGIETTNEGQRKIIDLTEQHGYKVKRFGRIKIDPNKFGLEVEYFNHNSGR